MENRRTRRERRYGREGRVGRGGEEWGPSGGRFGGEGAVIMMMHMTVVTWNLNPYATFCLHGARGGTPGWGRNILLSTPVAAKKTSADGGGTGVSSQDEALEEAAVGTVGEGGGRPGPHPKPNKGWGPLGVCMRHVSLGLVGCLGRSRGKTEGGVGGR